VTKVTTTTHFGLLERPSQAESQQRRPASHWQLQSLHETATIVRMGSDARLESLRDRGSVRGRFTPGCMVVATLCNPREKFWGMILALAPEGLSLSGAELASFEDLATMVKDGEPFTPAVVFFPMHRIERIELDLPDGSLSSLSQRFFSRTGLEPAVALMPPEETCSSVEARPPHAQKENA
jgi:hypothetical protein